MSEANKPSPNPAWKPLDKQPHPFGNAAHKSIDPQALASSYFLTISAVVPRPVAFVSSRSAAGINNLAPFSYFNAVAHDPPTLCVGICKNRDGSNKDTLNNIEETGEFVVNIISDWMVESANHTCGAFPPNVDEMSVVGLTPLPSEVVAPPRVAESAVNMECKLSGKHEVVNDKGEVTCIVVFGRVVRFHVLEPLVEDGPRGPSTPQVCPFPQLCASKFGHQPAKLFIPPKSLTAKD
jgi:flavin reductase (DIM6/NTAB) family NADH-FMN oxidoreductase RutF